MALAWLFTSFATKLHQIVISYSIILAAGVCITQASSTIMIGQYFKKNRLHLEIIMNSWTGVSLCIASMIQYCCLHSGGWRIGLQITTGVVSVSVLTSLMLRPASVYHPQRHAILHMRHYMRQVLGKTRYKHKGILETLARCKTRTVRMLLVTGALSSIGLLTPLLIGPTLARWSDVSETQVMLMHMLQGISFATASYISGRLCLYRRAKNICVSLVLLSGVLILLSQMIPFIQIKIVICSMLGGAISCSNRVFLYKNARLDIPKEPSASIDKCKYSRSHYVSVLSLLQCVQSAPTFMSVFLYSSSQYGPLWTGACNIMAGLLMLLHIFCHVKKECRNCWQLLGIIIC